MIDIREVKTTEIEQVSKFLLKTMQEVYPFQLSEKSLRDLTEMESLFIERTDATMIAAFHNERVVGTIAVRRYDGRIASLFDRYNLDTTCEIIKCYVDKSERRKGIGSLLMNRVRRFCREANYSTLYLHTHHFLPGGFHFWTKKGFQVTIEDMDEFETIHMEQLID
ncbi:GNAT family N-acetyltransferase [Halalkalibacter alkaliphilus]|uniref:GNAT family N-acetyltransferase n=1 Tax=Halalkalibacter alkaliphilus TaxID=2917993 RepID=A0A9X2I6V4_9BACI|nr:GNAT family N-acetyltransferase [Halalkalibacter alkaliphilus]MCL7748868.1 GNAT family N-acetyltransferase [Halalkalibacter alkaliphilus]